MSFNRDCKIGNDLRGITILKPPFVDLFTAQFKFHLPFKF
jgi:hypothetical protein